MNPKHRSRFSLLAAMVVAGCGGGEDDIAADLVAPAVTYVAPANNAASVGTNSRLSVTFSKPMDAASLGAALGLVDAHSGERVALGSVAYDADNRIATPVDTFSSGDTIHASVETDGEARRLTARWTHLDSNQVFNEEHKDVAAGAQVTDFHVSNPDGWPSGRYRVEVSQDGNVVSSSEFTVQ